MRQEEGEQTSSWKSLVGTWYWLDLSLGEHGEKAPVLVCLEDEGNGSQYGLAVCWGDEAATPICRISISSFEWVKLLIDSRVKAASGYAGLPIDRLQEVNL